MVKNVRHPALTTWEWETEMAAFRLHEGELFLRFQGQEEFSRVQVGPLSQPVGELLRFLWDKRQSTGTP